MARTHRPIKGSRGYSPRKRAKSETLRIRNWPELEPGKLLGFAGYKAGMTHAYIIDDAPHSGTKDQEIFVPCTIIETPHLILFGVRAYKKTPYGSKIISQAFSEKLDKELDRRILLGKTKRKGLADFEKIVGEADELRAMVHTQPIKVSGIPKKAPEIMEMHISGTKDEQLAYIKEKLGSEVAVEDVFAHGELIDTIAVTTGKGTQGVRKRYGVKLQKRKQGHSHARQTGAMGGRMGVKWTVPMAGQTGYHKRTEYNKRILAVNKEGINVNGGFPHFGEVKNECILLKGSVPGPRKRMIRLRHAIRPKKDFKIQEPSITYISAESKQ